MIDVQGEWRVWNISRSIHQGRARYYAHLMCCFPVPKSISEPTISREHLSNQILWIGDANTVLICTRHTLYACDISLYTPRILQALDVGLQNSMHRILHVQRSPQKWISCVCSHLYKTLLGINFEYENR